MLKFNQICGQSFRVIAALSLVVAILTFQVLPTYAATAGSVGTWQTTTPLPTETFVASGATYNGYVYNIAGTTNAGDTNKVFYSKINTDGTLSSWITSPNNFPETFRRATSVASNGYLYVVGGYSDSHLQFNTVYYAALSPTDGSVGAWNTTTVLPNINQSEAVVVNNNFMYVIGGGRAPIGNVNEVHYAPINANGTLGSWTTSSNTLPQPLRRIGGVVNNNFVYITGGITTAGTPSNTVYYAPLNNDGSVGSWSTSPNVLPTAVWDAATTTSNGYIGNAGGKGASGSINKVYYAPLNNDGSVGSWIESANSLPDSVNGSVGLAYNNFIYNIGGESTTLGNIATVYYAALTPNAVVVPPAETKNSPTAPNTGFGTILANPITTLIGYTTLSFLLFYGAYRNREDTK